MEAVGLSGIVVQIKDCTSGPKQPYIYSRMQAHPDGVWFVDDDHNNFAGLEPSVGMLHVD